MVDRFTVCRAANKWALTLSRRWLLFDRGQHAVRVRPDSRITVSGNPEAVCGISLQPTYDGPLLRRIAGVDKRLPAGFWAYLQQPVGVLCESALTRRSTPGESEAVVVCGDDQEHHILGRVGRCWE